MLAAVRPQGKPEGTWGPPKGNIDPGGSPPETPAREGPMPGATRPRGKPEATWALPKGNIDPGESPAETAVGEVLEETGVQGRLVEKLGDVKYTSTRRGGPRVFKVVSFYLLRAGR